MRSILQDQGDDGSKPRLVHHVAYFNTDEDMAAFSKAVEEMGYTIEKSPEPDAIGFSMTSPVSGEKFEADTQLLKQKAAEFEGQYDGWGCNVVID